MIFAWQEPRNEGGGSGTRIASAVFGRNRRCMAFSVIRKRVLSSSSGAQKNGLRMLWSGPDGLVRSQAAPGARSVVWRHAGLSRIGGAAARLPHLRQGETGATRFIGGQSALHQTVCTLCRPAVSGSANQGGGGGIEAGLAYGQGA